MKKVLIIIGIIIGIIILTIAIGMTTFVWKTRGIYHIPQNYIRKIEDHQAYMDGADNDYYVYNDRIIQDEKWEYPLGSEYTHEHRITVYNIDGAEGIHTLDDLMQTINDKEGKEVLHKKY